MIFEAFKMQEQSKIHTNERKTQPDPPKTLGGQTGGYLSLVALLGTQTRSSGVKLLGYDTQELGLVLSSVAVRGADVHHLGDEHVCTERDAEERRTEAV